MNIHSEAIHSIDTKKDLNWINWKWQQRNAIKSISDLTSSIDGLPIENISKHIKNRKIQITPYYLKLIKHSIENNGHKKLLNQVIPFWEDEVGDGYNGQTENWELSSEMKTPICQHKYDNRVILRVANICNSYCQFCFEALRTINTTNKKQTLNKEHWSETLKYISKNPSIEEVILSGGEPLMLNDKKLGSCLADIRDCRPDILLRIHSRSLTFNPFRITEELLKHFDKSQVTSFGVHVCHPDEITREFIDAIKEIRKVVPIIFANIPLLKGINDDYETLCKLFLTLYRNGILPYYLYHFMPFSPGSSVYRASIKDVVKIMRKIKRHKSNIAIPEYVLPHVCGKFTVPLINDAAEFPKFIKKGDGTIVYRFHNWLGNIYEWRDSS